MDLNPNVFLAQAFTLPSIAKLQIAENTKSDLPTDEPWPDLEPFNNKLLDVAPFPLDLMPKAFRPWIKNIEHRTQCAPDGIGMAHIVISGALVGARCAVHPKANDDWVVVPNLWGGIIGDPSTKKSMAISESLKGLSRLEIEMEDNFKKVKLQYQADLMEYEALIKAKELEMKIHIKSQTTAKTDHEKNKATTKIQDIKNELMELEPPEKPSKKRYKTNDQTEENLEKC